MSKHKVKVEKDGAERYLLTYADLMNLLLIFFIVLYSMSQVDSQKFQQLSTSLRSVFGEYMPGGTIGQQGSGTSLLPLNPSDSPLPSPLPQKVEQQRMGEVKDEVSKLIDAQHLNGDVTVTLEERGVVVSITAKLLFKSGSADIERDSIPVIESIGKMLLSLPGNHIRVEGNTDTDPIRTSSFPSNWELSSARATNVLRLLVEKSGINPKVISAVGYGEHRPKFANDSEEHKAANRRVDIVLVSSIYDKSEAGKK